MHHDEDRVRERLLCLALALVAVAAGCAMPAATEQDAEGEPQGAAEELVPKIWRGVTITAPTAVQQKIVLLHTIYGSTYCTGSLINPYTILTAAHCMPDVPNAGTTTPADVYCGGRIVAADGSILPFESDHCWVWRNGGWKPNAWKDDFGLINLPYPLITSGGLSLWTGSVSDGERLDFFGWGFSGATPAYVTLRRDPENDPIVVDDVTNTLIKSDADLRVARICAGDSGSPWLRQKSPQAIAGIAVAGARDDQQECTQSGGEMIASRMRVGIVNWINERLPYWTGYFCWESATNSWRCW